MSDFPGNSHKAARSQPGPAPERERVQRITSAEATRRKGGLGQQFKKTFIGGNAKLAVHYMIVEVVIPAVQDTMIDAFQGGIERLIRGESRPRRGGGYGFQSNRTHVDYSRFSASSSPPKSSAPPWSPGARSISRASRSRQNFDEVLIPIRQEAEEVLEMMFNILGQYGTVSVSEFYAMVGVQASHTDQKWGWTELRGSRVEKQRTGGFLIRLPDPEPLD